MKNNLYSLLKFAIGWPLSILALFFIFNLLVPQMSVFITHIRTANLLFLFFALLCFIVFYFLRSTIWFLLIKKRSPSLGFTTSSFFWASSELKRYIPGNIWSFLGRTVLFAEKGVPKKDIAKSLLVEAELYVLGCALVSLLALPFLSSHFFSNSTLWQYVIVFVIITFVCLYIFSNKFSYFLHQKSGKILLLLPENNASDLVRLVSISCFSLIFFGLGYYLSIAAVVSLASQSVFQLVGFFVLSFVIGYLTFLTPAGFGAREGMLILGLSKLLTVSSAAFAALFARIILIIAELIFILVAFLLYKYR